MSEKRAFQVCIEMLEQRRYKIVEMDEVCLRAVAVKPCGEKMIVLFNSTPKFDTKSLKDIISSVNVLHIVHVLIIYTEMITPPTKNILSQLTDIRFELFCITDLQYNITKHCLQPKFEELSISESEQFIKKYGSKFGVLRLDRPIARFYDYKKNSIIRIIRPSGYVTYRIVK